MIACIERKIVSGSIRAIEAALSGFDNNMIILVVVDHHNC